MKVKESIKENEVIKTGKGINQGLETERLNILSLQPYQLALSVENYGEMQTELGLKISAAILEEEMQYAMKVRLKKSLQDVENYLWLTNWAIIHKEENQIIGFIMIKGCPNEIGEVIVGYDLDEAYRRNGYATESLNRLTEWIFENPKALSVIADTEKDNIPSHKLLQKVGAFKFKETDELIWWKIERKH